MSEKTAVDLKKRSLYHFSQTMYAYGIRPKTLGCIIWMWILCRVQQLLRLVVNIAIHYTV